MIENLHVWLAEGSSRTWPWMINHLWQSTLFVAALAPALLLLRRAPARLRYSVSLLASLKFFLPSAIFLALLVRFAPRAGESLPALTWLSVDFGSLLSWLRPPAATAVASSAGHDELFCLLSLLWLVGSLALAVGWWRRNRRFARVMRRATMMTDGPEAELLEQLRRRLKIRRPVRLALGDDSLEPGVWRALRPVLVMPAEMRHHLDQAELEALFLHELVHVRRWDNLVASLHMALCCLFWFHPVVWLLDRRLLAEREEACDERVLELAGGSDTYLRSLLKAVRFGIGWRLAGVSSAAGLSHFRRRIERIQAGELGRRPVSWVQRGSLLLGVVLLMAFSVTGGPVVGETSRGPLLRVTPSERLECPKKHAERKGGGEGISLPAWKIPPPPASADNGAKEDCTGEDSKRWARREGDVKGAVQGKAAASQAALLPPAQGQLSGARVGR